MADPVAATRDWIQHFVIGLNLCPFAKKVFDAGRIRFVTTAVTTTEELLAVLGDELRFLAAAPREDVETTILIHPNALIDFRDYNDFLSDADRVLERLGFRGVFQIASFHPQYQFAGTRPEDVENYTNRSPHPMLHLLREVSISEVAGNEALLAGIPGRNVAVLRGMGLAAVERFRTGCGG